MNRNVLLASTFMVLVFSVCTSYSQQIKSISGANNETDDTNPVFIGNNTLLFTRAFDFRNLGGKSDPGDIWMIKKDSNGAWTEAVHRPDLSSKGYDLALGLEDVLTLLVLRTEQEVSSVHQFSKFGQDWNYLRKVNFPDLSEFKGPVTGKVSQDGKLIFISGNKSGGYGNEDLYLSQKTGVIDWSAPVNLGPAVNGSSDEQGPFFDPESQMLYFSSSSHQGATGRDILVAKKIGQGWDTWSKPEKWEQVSTKGSETSITFISKEEIIWTSAQNSDGLEDLMAFVSPVNLAVPSEFQEFIPTSESSGRIKTPASNSAEPGPTKSSEVNLQLTQPVSDPAGKSEEPEIPVSWLVMDANLKIEIPFLITWLKESSPRDFPVESKRSDLEAAGVTSAKVSSKGYFPVFLPINELISKGKTVVLMTKAESGSTVVLKDIQFKAGTSELEGEITFGRLKEIAEFLLDHPNLIIRINGHTDNIGDPSLNKELSLQRATSVRNYLISNGVDFEKLRISGWGGTKPLASNSTEAGRAKNRRVELTVEN